MDINKENISPENESLKDKETKIKEYLKTVVSEEIYNTWVDNFEFEKIDYDSVTVGYYGDRPLKELTKDDKDAIWNGILECIEFSKNFKIYKRKNKMSSLSPTMKKNIKTLKLFVISAVFVCFALVIAFVMCNYIINRNFRETFFSVSSLKNDNKIRIVQISDLHNARYGKDNKKLIDRVEKLNPDIILYTGDIIDSKKDKEDEVVNLCEKLSKVAPSYYVYGNNEVEKIYKMPLTEKVLDKKFGVKDGIRNTNALIEFKDDFETKLEKAGVKVLKNEMDSLVVGTTNIDVFGVLNSNPSSFFTYAGESYENFIYTNPDNLKITAIHEPFIYEEFDYDMWGDLIVCGHTHGGTMKIPLIGPLYTHEGGFLPEKSGSFVYGRYNVSGTPIIVSSGLENNNIFRINNQPELAVIDINKF